MPPQNVLLALPSVMVSGAYAAKGGGIACPSSARAWWASSTTATVAVRRRWPAYASRWTSVIRWPVGFWKSGTR